MTYGQPVRRGAWPRKPARGAGLAPAGDGGRGGQPPVSHGFHPRHTERLATFWAEALGGPATYTDSLGDEASVVRMHRCNKPHEEMDRRAIAHCVSILARNPWSHSAGGISGRFQQDCSL